MGFVINPYWFATVGGGSTPTSEGNSGIFDNTSSNVPPAVTYPAGLQSSDIAFLHAYLDDPSTANSINTPAGWNLVDHQLQNGDTSTANAVYWKRLDGTETGTVTVTSSSAVAATDTLLAVMSIWRGCIASGTPYEGLANNTGGSTTLTGAAVTTTGPNRRVVHFGGHSGTASATPSAGWTEVYDYDTPSGSPEGGAKCYAIEAASASTVGPATHTLSIGRGWQVIAIALIPA